MTLDQLFNEHDIRYCRILKISAPGAIRESLKGFSRSDCIDLLCGEVESEDCSEASVEASSWRIARQHFWRIVGSQPSGTLRSWIHQTPMGIERGLVGGPLHRP